MEQAVAASGAKRGARLPQKNQQGQTLGAKGARTRERLTEATANLLAVKPLRELRVAQIARAARTSTATFYLYFADADDAVLAVIAELSQSTPELLGMLAEDWPGDQIFARARAFASSYVAFWRAHRSVFHARNLAADEGDARFIEARALSIRPLLDALAAKIAAGQARLAIPGDVHPASTAGALIAMLERLAEVGEHRRQNRLGITTDRITEGAAYILAMALHGEGAAGAAPALRSRPKGGQR